MGPCRICGEPGCYGFGEPGPYSQRRRKGHVWACPEHRDEVNEQWREAFGIGQRIGKKHEEAEQVSREESAQPRLDL